MVDSADQYLKEIFQKIVSEPFGLLKKKMNCVLFKTVTVSTGGEGKQIQFFQSCVRSNCDFLTTRTQQGQA